jgi:hypothetical protein
MKNKWCKTASKRRGALELEEEEKDEKEEEEQEKEQAVELQCQALLCLVLSNHNSKQGCNQHDDDDDDIDTVSKHHGKGPTGNAIRMLQRNTHKISRRWTRNKTSSSTIKDAVYMNINTQFDKDSQTFGECIQ